MKIPFTFLFLMAFLAGFSQVNNAGGTITVENGATLVIEGSYTSTSTGTIEIDGQVNLKGDFINNSGSIATGSTGRLSFTGSAAQAITGSASTTFYCAVEVNNSTGVALTTGSTGNSQVLDSTLILTSGKVTLNGFNLELSNEGVSGADATKYLVTNSTGKVKALVGASNYTFPVGNASYNPVILNEAGTSDTYSVSFVDSYPAGWTGTNHAVLGYWDISDVSGGGNNLAVTTQWNTAQEQAPFDRTDCAVGRQVTGNTVAWTASGAATGTGPWTRSGSGFNAVGLFMVGDYFFEGIDVDLDLWLAGPYNSGTGLMNTSLLSKSLIPLTDPYSLGVTVSSIPANTVDWIKVELRDKTNSATVLYTGAFFLDNTGNVISPDGSSIAKIKGMAKDQYYIAVKHRNHIGAMTNNTVDLTAASPAFNFKSGANVYQIQTYTPMFSFGGGVYGLYKGNVNGDTRVSKVGTPGTNDYSALLAYLGSNTVVLNVYAGADVNMDGDVRKVGTPGVNDYSHLLNSLGSLTTVLQQVP